LTHGVKIVLGGKTLFKQLRQAGLGFGLEKILSSLIPFLAVKLIGVAEFGEFSFYLSIISVISIFCILGLDRSIIYFEPTTENKYISASLVIPFFMSIILGAAACLFDTNIIYYLPLLVMLSVQPVFMSIYKVKGKFKKYYAINIIARQITTIALLVILSGIGYSLNKVTIAFTIGFFLAQGIILLDLRSFISRIHLSKELLSYTLPLLISSGMVIIITNADVIMLKFFTSATNVGIYSIAVKIAAIPSYVLMIFNMVFAPEIRRKFAERKRQELTEIYKRSTRIIALSTIVISLLIIFILPHIILFLGVEFNSINIPVIIILIGQIFNGCVGSVWNMLIMTGRNRIYMYSMISAAIINIVFNMILIPHWGINGAATASVVSMIITNIVGYIFVGKIFKVKVYGIL